MNVTYATLNVECSEDKSLNVVVMIDVLNFCCTLFPKYHLPEQWALHQKICFMLILLCKFEFWIDVESCCWKLMLKVDVESWCWKLSNVDFVELGSRKLIYTCLLVDWLVVEGWVGGLCWLNGRLVVVQLKNDVGWSFHQLKHRLSRYKDIVSQKSR